MNRPPSDVATALAAMPDVVAALNRDHVPDARDYCRACGMPGTGSPYLQWPCPLRRIADTARRIQASTAR